jgi:hypothetical protein
MVCVALGTSFTAEAFRAAGALPDHIVPDFEAFIAGPLADLIALSAESRP